MKQKNQDNKPVISNNIEDLTFSSEFYYDAEGEIYIRNLKDGKYTNLQFILKWNLYDYS